MIQHIKGTIELIGAGYAVVSASGIGYKIFTTPDTIQTLSRETGKVALWTHLAVRENSMDLYGFLEHAELNFFEMLITISGIGPKGALGILSIAPIDTLKQAISTGDTIYLTKVSGIGRKNAEKIVIELKDKLGAGKPGGKENSTLKEESDALEALIALGYSQHEARESLKKIDKEIVGTNEKVRAVLKSLGKN